MTTPKNIADWFLNRAKNSGEALTLMKVQKFVYLSYGWYLALKDKKLFNDDILVKEFGPHIKSLVTEFGDYGSDGISAGEIEYVLTEPELNAILSRIWDVYSKFTSHQLTGLITAGNSPWTDCIKNDLKVIPTEMIKTHYLSLVKKV